MANNKTTYVLEIDAEVSSLKSKLETTKIALDKLGDSSFSAGMGKKITSILTQLEKLQKKASQPIDSKATFSSLEKGFGSIVVDAKNLLSELEKISGMTTREKLSLLPEDEAKKLKEALSAVQAYTKAVEKAEKARIRAQERRKGERETTSAQLDTARETHKKAKASYEGATARGTEYGDAKAIVAQAEAAKKAQKEIDALEKQLKRYQKRLEELNSIENRTEEQEAELQTTRSNVKSVGGKIGARKKIVKNGPDEKTLTAANKTIEDQTPTIEALEQSVAQAEKEVTRLENALAKLDEAIKNNSTKITESQADYRILYEQAKKLGVSLEGVTEDVNPTNVRILTERMRDLVNDGVKPLDNAIEQVTPDVKELGDVAAQTGEKISGAEEHFGSMVDNQSRIDNLKENIRQFIGWAGASKVLSAAMRNAFEDIKELDKAMTEIAVVTDFDIGDMWDQMPTYTARANELGLEITEVYEASALFYQQGLDTNEMIALSNQTLKMAKIAGLDAAEATDRMTAALRGFNMELDEASAQKVADVYSELAAITASDVDEISSAMTKTASIASSAGMEFETTAAFLSQIIETTRESAETAGTAMKTVIARFQELKKSPDEIGEIDGEIVDANQIEKALRSVGVSLRDAGGQFRELDDVFLELSSKWDGLDKNTQRYIATIAAGSRQQSRFIAMMSNYARTQELVTAANNSAGASQKQYEKTMESIETKLKRLENAWTEFSTGLLNSDLVKFAVDFLTSILNALNRVTQGFEGFTGSLSKIGTLIAIFQTAKAIVGKFFDEILINIYKSSETIGENIAKGVKKGLEDAGGADAVTSEATNSTTKKKLGAYASAKKGVGQVKESRQKFSQLKLLDSEINDDDATIKLMKDNGEAIEEVQKAEADLAEKIKKRDQLSKEANQASAEGFKNIANGAQVAAQAVTMIGVGFGMVGQMFQEAGLNEAGEFFQEFGNILTFVGGIVGMLVPIISLLGTTVTVAGEEMTIAGYMVQEAWWPILLIGLAIAAVIATIILVANAIKKASPEYKLEQTQKAADKAADAADRAKKSYEGLVNTFEELETGYDALKNLTRGTKEWDEAVKDINSSVLDLIEQYPELAKFVDNEGGVLTIDMEDSNVQQVLKDAEASAIVAQNSATIANLSVIKAEDDLAYKNLDNNAKFNLGGANAAYGGAMAGSIAAGAGAGAGIGALVGTVVPVIGNAVGAAVGAGIGAIGGLIGGFFTGEAAKDAALEDTQSQTEALAKAIADGAIIDSGSGYDVKDKDKLIEYGVDINKLDEYYAEVGDSTEALRDFGEQLLQTSAQEEAAFAAVATSAYQLADTLGMTKEEQVQASNIVDDASVKKMYDENMAELADIDFTAEEGSNAITDDQRKMRDDAIRAQYGADARIEGNKVTFRDADGQQMEELTNDEIKAIIANNMTTKETTKAVEMAPETVDHVISAMGFSKDSKEAKAIESAVMDQEGGNLTAEEAATLAGFDDKKLEQIYSNMSEEQKNVFGSQEEYLKKIKGAGQIANNAFENARKSIEKTGAEIKGFMTADMAKGFTSKMEEVWEVSGEEGVKQIQDAYNKMLEGKDDKTAQEITARMNSFDWSNTEQLLAFEIELEEQYGYSREEAQAMTKAMTEGAKATSNLTTTVEIFGDFYHATEKLNSAIQKTADLQWEYERMLKKGANAIELATNLEAQRQSILEQGTEALEAYEYAREDQAKVYAKGVNLPGVGKDVTQYVKFDPNTGTYDLTELQRQINAEEFGAEGSDSRKAVEDYISELKEANKLANDQLDAAKDAYEQLEELNEAAEQGYQDLYDQIGEVITATAQKQIDLQESLLDATKKANSKIVDKLQEQINEDRQDRQNAEAEENIADMYSQMAYLGMDTSGSNALSMVDLEKQIADAEQDYEDSRIDQSIQQLQDSNAKAEEQRERQISIAEQQLELYKKSDAYWHKIDTQMSSYLDEYERYEEAYMRWQDAQEMTETEFNEKYSQSQGETWEALQNIANKPTFSAKDTELGRSMVAAGFTEGMSSFAEKDFWDNVEKNTADSVYHVKRLEEYSSGDGQDSQQTLLENIDMNTGVDKLIKTQYEGEFKAAKGKEDSILNTTGYNIRGSFDLDDEAYKNSDGSFNTSLASDHVNMANRIYNSGAAEKVASNNTTANNLYNTYASWSGSNKPLTQDQYYEKLEKGEVVNIGDATFSAETFETSMAAGGTEGDYLSYMTAYDAQYSSNKTERRKRIVDSVLNSTQKDGRGNPDPMIMRDIIKTKAYEAELKRYKSTGASEDDFKKAISERLTSGYVDGSVTNVAMKWGLYQLIVDGVGGKTGTHYTTPVGDSTTVKLNKMRDFKPTELDAAMLNNNLYIYRQDQNDNGKLKWFQASDTVGQDQYLKAIRKYKTGGLADFTGPAWLDGTPSRPEYILNAAQTERFFSLIDILEGYDDKKSSGKSGDNYFDIEINVEKLENDYDVEKVADKIRRMIYDDATYRNVNAINHIR